MNSSPYWSSPKVILSLVHVRIQNLQRAPTLWPPPMGISWLRPLLRGSYSSKLQALNSVNYLFMEVFNKNYCSLYLGTLYVIDTREHYLHLYHLRILFSFCIVCKSVDKRGFPSSFYSLGSWQGGRCSICFYLSVL